jgi:ADP-heptose:LPS heptosyltransferase
MAAAAWRRARRILAVRLDALGDVLMTTPALRALKRLPQRPHLTLLTSPAGAAAARLVPEIDEVRAWTAPWMKAAAAPDPAADRALIEELALGGYDAAVIFTVYSQSPWPAALLCTLAGIPLRLAHGRENPYQLLSDWVPEREPEETLRHEVSRQLELVETIGARADTTRLSLAVPPPAREKMRERLRDLGLEAASFVLIHPGASAPSRRYPIDRLREVARRLAARGMPLVGTGGPGDREALDALAEVVPLLRVDTPALEHLAALIEAAPLLLCNNSGPAHVAAAVGTPLVVLYALTNPQHTPWEVNARVLFHVVPCAFCYKSRCPAGHHECLAGVPPESVVEAALELLADPAREHRVRRAARAPRRP